MTELEQRVKKFLQQRGWDQLRPGDVAKSIAIEAAELLEHFQWINPSVTELKQDQKKMAELGNELADVFIYCLELCVLTGLNSESIIEAKMRHNCLKYPASLVRRGGLEAVYRQQLKYRKKNS